MFYLVHGTADNNVHFQHSMVLARHLAKKDIFFQQQVKNYSEYNSSFWPLYFSIQDICVIILYWYYLKFNILVINFSSYDKIFNQFVAYTIQISITNDLQLKSTSNSIPW